MNQREVFEVYFPFPDGRTSPHPVIVLSTPEVLHCENTFIGVPISHAAEWNDDEFSFPIYNEDFDHALKYPNSYARLHLITVIPKSALVTGKK